MVFEERTLTYAALDAHANRLAHHLQGLGVGPETVVGLCVERSPEMVVGLLGILKAGGAYLPLDPNYPRERLAFMLADAGCAGAGDASGAARPAAGRRRPAARSIVRLDADWPAIARQPGTAPPLDLDPRHPAYVIYTSGSTGTPKGVVVEHASLANKVITLGQEFGVAPGFRIALLSSCAFDPSIEQATLPLVHGASIVVINDATRESPHQLWEQLVQQKVNLLNCTPSFFELVRGDAPQTTSLKHLVLGGEALSSELQREISRSFEMRKVTNLYSPPKPPSTPLGTLLFATKMV